MSISAPGAPPAPGFEQPFEMLHACHERVHRTLDLMQRLQEHMARHGADDQARQAAVDVMRYFDLAAPQHHLDEERHVFPVLLASPDARLREAAQQLQREHEEMDRAWAELRQVLHAVVTAQTNALAAEDGQRMRQFTELYRRHIDLEEQMAYPHSRERLANEAMDAMTRDMMARRGVGTGG